MKRLQGISFVLIAVGLLVLFTQGVQHVLAARRGQLPPFDEDGEKGEQIRVLIPFAGTACLGTGIFMLVLTSGRKPTGL